MFKSSFVQVFMVCSSLLVGCADGPGAQGGAVVVQDDPDSGPIGSGTPVSPAMLAGSWQLTRVDEQSLPVNLSDNPMIEIMVSAARLTIDANGTWIYRYDYRQTDFSGTTVGSSGTSGTWRAESQTPLTVSFVDDSGRTWIAVMTASNSITLQANNRGMVFTKVAGQ